MVDTEEIWEHSDHNLRFSASQIFKIVRSMAIGIVGYNALQYAPEILPDGTGKDVAKKIRQVINFPAQLATEVTHKITGLEKGRLRLLFREVEDLAIVGLPLLFGAFAAKLNGHSDSANYEEMVPKKFWDWDVDFNMAKLFKGLQNKDKQPFALSGSSA
jgi:hypothetical protein